MGGAEERWSLLRRRKAAPPQGDAPPPPAPDAAPDELAAPSRPFQRPPTLAHHWLTVVVARPGPAEPIPASGARVVVRPHPRGATRPEPPVAQGTTAADGTIAFLLPPGRYALAARHAADTRAVTVTLEHAGRATLILENALRRVTLHVDATRDDGLPLADAAVEARAVPSGAVAARGVTDHDGLAALRLPPGAYEVRIGATAAKTYLETDTLLRLTADTAPRAEGAAAAPATPGAAAAPPALTRYAMRAREATAYAAPFETARVRDDAALFN